MGEGLESLKGVKPFWAGWVGRKTNKNRRRGWGNLKNSRG